MKLRGLKLSGMAEAVSVRNQEVISSHLAYTDFLELLVEDELAKRRDRLYARRLKQAHIPEIRSLENFDWSFNPKLPKSLIFDLATARFAAEHAGEDR
jgi:DNA replication protein DnaC